MDCSRSTWAALTWAGLRVSRNLVKLWVTSSVTCLESISRSLMEDSSSLSRMALRALLRRTWVRR